MPGSKQAWPNSAACWSPAMPLTGTPAGRPVAAVVTPNRPLDGRTSGSAATGHAEQVAQLPGPARGPGCRRASCGWRWRARWRGPRRRSGSRAASCRWCRGRGAASASTPPSCRSHSTLVPEKYGSSTRPVRSRTRSRWPGVAQLVAAGRGAPVLPDDGPVAGPAGAAVPGHDRLALVGDAERGDRLVQLGDELVGHGHDRGPDLGGVVLDPAGPGEVLGELLVAVAGRAARSRRRRRPAPRSCLRRGRSRSTCADRNGRGVERGESRTHSECGIDRAICTRATIRLQRSVGRHVRWVGLAPPHARHIRERSEGDAR